MVSAHHSVVGVSAILAVQQLVYVGRISATHLQGQGSEEVADAFRILSIILFDIEFVKVSV